MDLIILFVVTFVAGMLNSIAGGGSFLTIAALIAIGLPPVSAAVTTGAVMLPGALASLVGYRHKLQKIIANKHTLSITCFCLFGAAIGSLLLLFSGDGVYRKLLPWISLLATILFAIGPSLAQKLARYRDKVKLLPFLLLILSSIIGGYFGGVLGVMLLCTFSILGQIDLHDMNALKVFITVCINILAFFFFLKYGHIYWQHAFLMSIAIVLGGYYGAKLAVKIPNQILRTGIIAICVILTTVYFYYL